MGFKVDVDTKEVDNWVNNQAHREIAKRQSMIVIKDETTKKINKVIGRHTTTGELQNSVVGKANRNGFNIYSANYGDIVLEYGRKPGRMPPVAPLERWAALHGMEGMGYVIARKIANQGTRKYQRGGPKELSWVYNWLTKTFLSKELTKLLDEYTK